MTENGSATTVEEDTDMIIDTAFTVGQDGQLLITGTLADRFAAAVRAWARHNQWIDMVGIYSGIHGSTWKGGTEEEDKLDPRAVLTVTTTSRNGVRRADLRRSAAGHAVLAMAEELDEQLLGLVSGDRNASFTIAITYGGSTPTRGVEVWRG